MTTTSTYNVETTLNVWFEAAVAAQSLPAWLTSVPVVFNMQEVTANLPCLSVVHIGISSRDLWMGRVVEISGTKGLASAGLMQIDAWVSRSHIDWAPQLASLQGLVADIMVDNPTVQLRNWQNVGYSGGSGALIANRVVLGQIEYLATAPDPNPDIERRRILVRYDWTQRGA